MMRKKLLINSICFLAISSFFLLYSEAQYENGDEILKGNCITAAIRGIKLEIDRNKGWLEYAKKRQETERIEKINERLMHLERELSKYKNMPLENFILPKKIETIAWIKEECCENSILYIEQMSRSGPWYHITGIKGNNLSIIQPNTNYLITFYLVYPREYAWMPSYYVYIDEISKKE